MATYGGKAPKRTRRSATKGGGGILGKVKRASSGAKPSKQKFTQRIGTPLVSGGGGGRTPRNLGLEKMPTLKSPGGSPRGITTQPVGAPRPVTGRSFSLGANSKAPTMGKPPSAVSSIKRLPAEPGPSKSAKPSGLMGIGERNAASGLRAAATQRFAGVARSGSAAGFSKKRRTVGR